MKTYPLNNSDISELESFKSAYENLQEAKEQGDTAFINHAHNWLRNRWLDLGTGLRKSGFDVSNTAMMHDKRKVYNHILSLNL